MNTNNSPSILESIEGLVNEDKPYNVVARIGGVVFIKALNEEQEQEDQEVR